MLCFVLTQFDCDASVCGTGSVLGSHQSGCKSSFWATLPVWPRGQKQSAPDSGRYDEKVTKEHLMIRMMMMMRRIRTINHVCCFFVAHLWVRSDPHGSDTFLHCDTDTLVHLPAHLVSSSFYLLPHFTFLMSTENLTMFFILISRLNVVSGSRFTSCWAITTSCMLMCGTDSWAASWRITSIMVEF